MSFDMEPDHQPDKEDWEKYEAGRKPSLNFIPQMQGAPLRRPGMKRISFRRPYISDRLKYWLGIGKLCGFAPAPIGPMCVFKDTLFLAAGATVYRLDKVNGEMVIVPFHETVCNQCKGELS